MRLLEAWPHPAAWARSLELRGGRGGGAARVARARVALQSPRHRRPTRRPSLACAYALIAPTPATHTGDPSPPTHLKSRLRCCCGLRPWLLLRALPHLNSVPESSYHKVTRRAPMRLCGRVYLGAL